MEALDRGGSTSNARARTMRCGGTGRADRSPSSQNTATTRFFSPSFAASASARDCIAAARARVAAPAYTDARCRSRWAACMFEGGAFSSSYGCCGRLKGKCGECGSLPLCLPGCKEDVEVLSATCR